MWRSKMVALLVLFAATRALGLEYPPQGTHMEINQYQSNVTNPSDVFPLA